MFRVFLSATPLSFQDFVFVGLVEPGRISKSHFSIVRILCISLPSIFVVRHDFNPSRISARRRIVPPRARCGTHACLRGAEAAPRVMESPGCPAGDDQRDGSCRRAREKPRRCREARTQPDGAERLPAQLWRMRCARRAGRLTRHGRRYVRKMRCCPVWNEWPADVYELPGRAKRVVRRSPLHKGAWGHPNNGLL
jgi:hypothetical protein